MAAGGGAALFKRPNLWDRGLGKLNRSHKMADNYEHGTMDVADKEVTFDGFLRWAVRVIVASIAVLIFLAIFNS
jgi:hypothetical protein